MQQETFVKNFVYGLPTHESPEWLLQQLLQCCGIVGITHHDGLPSVEETILNMVVDGFRYTLTRTWTETSTANYRLSPREQEIVQLVAKGLPNKSIAVILHISPATVATHIRRIFDKLNAKSRAEMVAQVFKYKLEDSVLTRNEKDQSVTKDLF